MFAALGFISLLIASAFWWAGAPFVLLFAGLEVTALGLAFLLHARQLDEIEELRLEGGELILRRGFEREIVETRYAAHVSRVRCSEATQGLIEISAVGQPVLVGRRLPPTVRQSICLSLNSAIRAC